jgi:uncharacterized membrane protein YoaT (DUF817 family)
MRKRLLAPNLTALLALAAFADLVLYRVLNAIFLPSQGASTAERGLEGLGSYMSNLSSVLGLLIVVTALLGALRSDTIFPRSMRITVTTIGLFFTVMAGMSVLWIPAIPRYGVHLRISHAFLVFFLALGIWHSARSWRDKIGVTLFAVPILLQALAFFVHRMGWSFADAGKLLRASHLLALAAMTAAPILLTPRPWKPAQSAIMLATGVALAAGLSFVTLIRFDLVQAVAFYGLRIDLTGMTSSVERLYTGATIVAFACVGAATANCLVVAGRSRLTGWGLLLLTAAGLEITSAKPALFTLCGLLALAMASAREESSPVENAAPASA